MLSKHCFKTYFYLVWYSAHDFRLSLNCSSITKRGTDYMIPHLLSSADFPGNFQNLLIPPPSRGPVWTCGHFPKGNLPQTMGSQGKASRNIMEGYQVLQGQILFVFTRACFLGSCIWEKCCPGLEEKPCSTKAGHHLPYSSPLPLWPHPLLNKVIWMTRVCSHSSLGLLRPEQLRGPTTRIHWVYLVSHLPLNEYPMEKGISFGWWSLH